MQVVLRQSGVCPTGWVVVLGHTSGPLMALLITPMAACVCSVGPYDLFMCRQNDLAFKWDWSRQDLIQFGCSLPCSIVRVRVSKKRLRCFCPRAQHMTEPLACDSSRVVLG